MGSLASGNVRLTNSIRDSIAKRVIQYKFVKTSSVLKDIRHEIASLAQAVYNDNLSETDQEKIASMPNGWLPESDHIFVQFGTDRQNLFFNGEPFSLTWSVRKELKYFSSDVPDVKKRIPDHMNRTFTSYSARHDLTNRYTDIDRKIRQFNTEVSESQKMLSAALSKATTTNRLIEMWPEVKPFVIEVVGNPKQPSVALMVPVANLNEKFGLPVPTV